MRSRNCRLNLLEILQADWGYMAGTTPKYAIGQSVYSRESAALGFLEAYQVRTITQVSQNRIVYWMVTGFSGPTVTPTMGDRVTNMYRPNVWFEESELITYCDALILAKANVDAQSAALAQLIASLQSS